VTLAVGDAFERFLAHPFQPFGHRRVHVARPAPPNAKDALVAAARAQFARRGVVHGRIMSRKTLIYSAARPPEEMPARAVNG